MKALGQSSDIDVWDVERRLFPREYSALIEAACGVANAIHVGAGAMIKGTLMEDDFRKALKLAKGQLVNIPKPTQLGKS